MEPKGDQHSVLARICAIGPRSRHRQFVKTRNSYIAFWPDVQPLCSRLSINRCLGYCISFYCNICTVRTLAINSVKRLVNVKICKNEYFQQDWAMFHSIILFYIKFTLSSDPVHNYSRRQPRQPRVQAAINDYWWYKMWRQQKICFQCRQQTTVHEFKKHKV